MFSGVRNALRKLRRHVSGNAAMLVALGMPALIGGAGLAVDTAQWYMWKHELQHAVDQAALGAAYALSDEATEGDFETRAQQEFDANKSITSDFATDPQLELADYAGGVDNSVIVTSSATRRLPFSSFLTGNAVTINVRSQASFAAGMDYNACLIALAQDDDVLDIGGSAVVRARCGLAALSCEDDAIVIDGSADVETDSIATCGSADVPEELEDVLDEGVAGLTDPYAGLSPPDNPTSRRYNCETTGRGASRSTQATLLPGTYTGGRHRLLQYGVHIRHICHRWRRA